MASPLLLANTSMIVFKEEVIATSLMKPKYFK
jgi:hypothetical protein